MEQCSIPEEYCSSVFLHVYSSTSFGFVLFLIGNKILLEYALLSTCWDNFLKHVTLFREQHELDIRAHTVNSGSPKNETTR